MYIMNAIETEDREGYRDVLISVIEGTCGQLMSVPYGSISTVDLHAIAEGIIKKHVPLPNNWDIYLDD